jgi:hypothetical protein
MNSLNRAHLLTALSVAIVTVIAACGPSPAPATAQAKVEQNIANSTTYFLTPEEQTKANINAQQYFNRSFDWAGGAKGYFDTCRNSDSNANGMVTCRGKMPKMNSNPVTYENVTMYCAYIKGADGCNDTDVVIKK